jgi:hypothetical protein
MRLQLILRACAVALCLDFSAAARAQGDVDDGSYTMLYSAGYGRFDGDYGEDEETTIDVLALNARRYFDRAEINLSVPYLTVDGEGVRLIDDRPVPVEEGAAPAAERESGLGDIVVRGEYYFRTGTSDSPWIIGLLRLKLPTGSEERGLGTGATDVEAGVGWIRRYGSVNWLADIAYTFVGGSAGLDPKNTWRYGAGFSVPFGLDERSNAYAYLENRTNRFAGSDSRRSLALGFGTAFDEAKRIRLSTSVFLGLSETAEDWGFYVTLGYRH